MVPRWSSKRDRRVGSAGALALGSTRSLSIVGHRHAERHAGQCARTPPADRSPRRSESIPDETAGPRSAAADGATAMIVPSAVQAVTSNSAGSDVSLDDQRMVAAGHQRVGQARQTRFGRRDRSRKCGRAPVRPRGRRCPPKRRADRLMPQADAQDRHLAGKLRAPRPASSRPRSGVQGPGESTTARGRERRRCSAGSIASLRTTRVGLAQPLEVARQVEHKAVVVVDQQDHG